MNWFSWLKREPVGVYWDEHEVRCRYFLGKWRRLAWRDLQEVICETTDKGPLQDDLIWHLIGKAALIKIPSEMPGAQLLLGKLQGLPGFDNHAAMDAAACTENRRFLCWKRG
ncbi:MAG TPA: hypothetical protein PLN21_18260 [Gemmatales bacterium]|nr:hypothetical protein [Gemmatales bacterium]